MTAAILAPAEPTAADEPTLRFVRLDEPITAVVGRYASPSEWPSLISWMGREATGPLTLVVRLRDVTEAAELSSLLGWQNAGHRLVVTGGPEELLEQIVASLGVPGSRQIAYEPNLRRAVAGAMQSLCAGDAFLLLGPAEHGLELLTHLVEHGADRRGSLEPADEAC